MSLLPTIYRCRTHATNVQFWRNNIKARSYSLEVYHCKNKVQSKIHHLYNKVTKGQYILWCKDKKVVFFVKVTVLNKNEQVAFGLLSLSRYSHLNHFYKCVEKPNSSHNNSNYQKYVKCIFKYEARNLYVYESLFRD